MRKLKISNIQSYITNIDSPDTPENYASELRGGVARKDGMVFMRDFGTLHRYAFPPMRPNAFLAITNATNASPIVVSTANTDGLANGDTVYISEVGGNTAANGKWVVASVVANTSFALVGSTGNGAYTSGGIWQSSDTNTARPPITIINGHTFVDTDGTETDIVVGLDSDNDMRIYVYDNGWVELTRYIDALINDTAGASDTNFDIDTITENGASYTPSADEFNNWVVVNTTQSNETVFITDCTATNLTVDTVIGSNGLNWANNDAIQIFKFPCFKFNYTYSNGATPLIRFLPVEAQRKVNILYEHTDGTNKQAVQVMKRDIRYYMHDSISAYNRTLPQGWYAESDIGILNPYYTNEGTISSAFTTTGYFREVTGLSGTTTVTVTTSAVHNLSTGDTIMFFGNFLNDVSGYWTITVTGASTFTLDKCIGSGSYTLLGGYYGYIIKVANASIYDQTSGRNWMGVLTGKYNTTSTTLQKYLRVYITLVYNYQESDPIFQGFYYLASTPTANEGTELYWAVLINFALMNKEITAIKIYAACPSSDTTAAANGWTDADSDYYLVNTINLQSNTPSTQYFKKQNLSYYDKPYFGTIYTSGTVTQSRINSLDRTNAVNGAATNISDALNHAVDKTRTYPTPRYAVRAARPQGAISVIDEDDLTLRLSNRNGDNVNEDDNFPNVAVDNEGSKLKAFLNSSGELLGLGILNDQIQAFKKTEREWIDLQSGLQGITRCDFIAKNSLVLNCPHGLAYAGEHGIYLLPKTGGDAFVLNPGWQNLYDGTLMVTGTTPYMSSAYRQAIVGGYDVTYDALWFVSQLNTAASTEYVAFVYSFARRPLSGEPVGWYQRKLNIGSDGSVKYFTNRRADGSLTIGFGSGILKYPNRSGSFLYQDDVLIDGKATPSQYSQSKGIPTRLKVHCGSLYDILTRSTINTIKIDYAGDSTSGTGAFNLKCYKDAITTAFETKTFGVDSAPIMRQMPAVGAMERFSFQIDLTEGDEEDFKELDISTVEMIVQEIPMIGNR